jgi:hypothetical protein
MAAMVSPRRASREIRRELRGIDYVFINVRSFCIQTYGVLIGFAINRFLSQLERINRLSASQPGLSRLFILSFSALGF